MSDVRSVAVPAVVTPRGLVVVMPDGRGGAWSTDSSGTAWWKSTDELRAFADECAADPITSAEEPWTPLLYRTLAEIIDRWRDP